MIDLIPGSLHAMREPVENVLGVLREYVSDVIQPSGRFCGQTGNGGRRIVEVEASAAAALDPAAFEDQLVVDDHRLARRPGHLLDGLEAIEPGAGA